MGSDWDLLLFLFYQDIFEHVPPECGQITQVRDLTCSFCGPSYSIYCAR